MSARLRSFALLAVMAAAQVAALCGRADAIPIFAQRYHLRCDVCHSVMPELNAFGNAFRDRGYRLPPAAQRHGTTVVALRYQMEYEKDPNAGSRRYTPGAVVLSNADIGPISAFVHYNLGAGGGPAGLYLGYLSTYSERTQTLLRVGQFEVPLPHSPGQRLDDLQAYGYEATKVGLNDLLLTSPRQGIDAVRTWGNSRIELTGAIGEFKGSAYGGKPVDTGEQTYVSHPEIGLFFSQRIAEGVRLGVEELDGVRGIVQTGKPAFTDAYRRTGIYGSYEGEKVDVLAQQWWGRDQNADGFGNAIGSTGGFARLRVWPLRWHHAFIGTRYDASANPTLVRDWAFYTGIEVTPHARVVLQRIQPIGGGPGAFGGALTIGFPWPLGY